MCTDTFDSQYVGTEFGDSQSLQDVHVRPFIPLRRHVTGVVHAPPSPSPRVPTIQVATTPTQEQGTTRSSARDPDWEHRELRILVAAKKWEWETIDSSKDQQKKMMNKNGKWKRIATWCLNHGLTQTLRDHASCQKKWDKLYTMWKKVYDWDKNMPSGHVPYFHMTRGERKAKKLPLDMDMELFMEMVEWLPEKEEVEPRAGILMDTITINEELQDVANKGKEKQQGPDVAKEKQPIGIYFPIPFFYLL